MPHVVTAHLYGGPRHGWQEQLQSIEPPHSVVVMECPRCGRVHLHPTDHWTSLPDGLATYWLDLEDWQATGPERGWAVYVYADPDSDLHVQTEENRLLAQTGAALGLDLATGQRVSSPGCP